MAMRYDFRVNDDRSSTTHLPVASDPMYSITQLDPTYPIGNCSIAFFDASGNRVTPTNGTIMFEAGDDTGLWFDPPSEATINANTVIPPGNDGTGVATYTFPSFDGPVTRVRVRFTGISGNSVNYATAFHYRFNS